MTILRLVLISDTHNQLRGMDIPNGDILIHSGDISNRGTLLEIARELTYFGSLPHKDKVFVAGNHDFLFEEYPTIGKAMALDNNFIYLEDDEVIIHGIKFYGSPYQPVFNGWAFNLPRNEVELEHTWNRIPKDTNILITHGPAYGILDTFPGSKNLGCEKLLLRIPQLPELMLHQFGHIHGSYGLLDLGTYLAANASSCNEAYQPSNKPLLLDLDTDLKTLHLV